MKNAPTGIELFCGCGGLSTGFLDAGIKIVAAFDIDRRAIEAYNYNHCYRGSKGIVTDLSRVSGAELLATANIPKIDILVGGPPCQPFSIVGKRLGSDDQRADLIFHFERLVRELQPQALLFENVPNLARIDEGRLFDRLMSNLRRQGFSLCAKILAAADFGVPQVRRRLVIIGAKGSELAFPKESHGASDLLRGKLKPYVSASDALDDLPPAGDFGECGIYNHEPTEHTPDMLSRFAKLEPGRREAASFHDRLHPSRPSFTLRAGTGNFSPLRPIHYRYDRVITVRESARLQGFRDEFIWPDWIPRLQQYRQVGNAVSPPLAQAIAQTMAKQLGWKRDTRAFRGKPENRPSAITMSDDERRESRRRRIRGASLGASGRETQKLA
jgi:DNA (cytosine-5)-methyltransferase 1